MLLFLLHLLVTGQYDCHLHDVRQGHAIPCDHRYPVNYTCLDAVSHMSSMWVLKQCTVSVDSACDGQEPESFSTTVNKILKPLHGFSIS